MAPNVSVPMNFGIRLLDSPTHSTLELKASQGAVIPASSVILSFNSPVIDHMTTTLHLTSVDMEEFSEDAVRYFVDAAYSGESPPISRVLFRDINKLANVFEMSWLATRCVEQFTEIAAAIRKPSYEDFLFLFEEAAFVLTQLKSREMVEIAFTKIQSLNGQQDLISRYLENMSYLTCQQLDLIIELAGAKVEFVVKPLTEQLTASLSRGETVVPANCTYLLKNSELYLCHQRNIKMFELLFDVLENITKESFTETKWTLQLLRKSVVKRERQSKSLVGSSTSTDRLDDVNVIPNLFHALDCSMTFDEVVHWLGKSEQVTNLVMFFEGLWTWIWMNKEFTVESSPQLLQTIYEIKENRKWNRFNQNWLNYDRHEFHKSSIFGIIKADRRFCSSEYEKNRWISLNSQNHSLFGSQYYSSILSLFEKETKVALVCSQYLTNNCSKPGKCGFILKTVSAKDGANIKLCTDSSEYSEEIHYHEEFEAKDMHISMYTTKDKFTKVSLSWCSRPEFKSGKVCWNLPSDMDCTHGRWLIHVVISLRDHNVSGT